MRPIKPKGPGSISQAEERDLLTPVTLADYESTQFRTLELGIKIFKGNWEKIPLSETVAEEGGAFTLHL